MTTTSVMVWCDACRSVRQILPPSCPVVMALRSGDLQPFEWECVVGQLDNGTSCDDNDPCTEGDMCDQGVCGGSPVNCEGEAACLRWHVTHLRAVTTVGGACDDGDGCTEQASCLGGACTALSTVTCTASVSDDAACNPETGACEETPNTAACDDGQPCTSNDALPAAPALGSQFRRWKPVHHEQLRGWGLHRRDCIIRRRSLRRR